MSTRLCDHKHPSCLDINKPANSPPQYVIEKPMICCLLRVDMIIPPGIASLCHYESKSLCFNPEVMSNYVHVNILHFHIEHGIYHFSCGDPRRPQQEEAILLFQACETTMNKTSLECVCVSVCLLRIQISGRPPDQQQQQRLFKQRNNKTCIIYCRPFCEGWKRIRKKQLAHVQMFGTRRTRGTL